MTGYVGLFGFAASFLLLPFLSSFPVHQKAVFVLVLVFLPMVLYELSRGVLSRPCSGLNWAAWKFCPSRIVVKLLGFLFTILLCAFWYWLCPEYRGPFYVPFWSFLSDWCYWFLVFSVFYVAVIDSVMVEPHDGYYHLGSLLLGRSVDYSVIRQHLLTWMVKLFFLPLMFVYLCKDLVALPSLMPRFDSGFMVWYRFIYHLLYTIDITYGCVGYLFTLRLFDSHVRSAESSPAGWFVALVCYQPFWSLIGGAYLNYQLGSVGWERWLFGYPHVQVIWGVMILLSVSVYVWATVVFGFCFSNLTCRRIIVTGPYRYLCHPAYVFKCLSYWLASVPFVASDWFSGLRSCVLLALVCGIYYLRAKCEERHLSSFDLEYSRYLSGQRVTGWLSPWISSLADLCQGRSLASARRAWP